MHPSPNLQQIAQQTREAAGRCKDQRWQLAFQSVSVISMAVLGVGTAVHLLREMLRHPHPHKTPNPETTDHDETTPRRWSERTRREDAPAEEDRHHRHPVRRTNAHGQHR
jgi:hypothetical protein